MQHPQITTRCLYTSSWFDQSLYEIVITRCFFSDFVSSVAADPEVIFSVS